MQRATLATWAQTAATPGVELVIAVPALVLIALLLLPPPGRQVAHPGPARVLGALALTATMLAALAWLATRA